LIVKYLTGTLGVLAAAVLFAACPGDTVAPPLTTEWFADLEGTPGWEHLSGEGGMLWTEGRPEIAARAVVTGDEPGASRPWHVHHNTCAEGGGIVGPAGAYPPLEVDATGEAEVITLVPIGVDPDANFHVNVHLSVDELETIIACGDLSPVAIF
jgi:superoxide dismutase, Cu-Zn family